MPSFIYKRIVVLIYLVLVAAVSFCGFYSKDGFGDRINQGIEVVAPWRIDFMLDGTAIRPFVYRQMIPDIANWAGRHVPEEIQYKIFNTKGGSLGRNVMEFFESDVARNPKYSFRYLVVYYLVFLASCFAAIFMYALLRAWDVEMRTALLATTASMFLIPYSMTTTGYVYDYPEAFLLVFAAFVCSKYSGWYLLPVAILGSWNKESFFFYVITLVPLLRSRYSAKVTGAITASALVLSTVVNLLIRRRFSGNGGGTVQFTLWDQLHAFVMPKRTLFGVDQTFGVITPKPDNLLVVAFFIWLAWMAWRHLPQALRQHALFAIAIGVPLYLFFGSEGEVRGMGILLVTVLFVMAATVTKMVAFDEKVPSVIGS